MRRQDFWLCYIRAADCASHRDIRSRHAQLWTAIGADYWFLADLPVGFALIGGGPVS